MAILVHQRHDATSLVERRIGKISFLFSWPSAIAPLPTVRCRVRFCSPIVGAGGSGVLARSLLWLCAPWGGLIRRLQPTRVLRSAEPSLQRSIRVAHLPG